LISSQLRGPIFYLFADVAVLRSENTSDRKSIVHTLSLKDGFLWGIYKKKGLGLFGAYQKERAPSTTHYTCLRDTSLRDYVPLRTHFHIQFHRLSPSSVNGRFQWPVRRSGTLCLQTFATLQIPLILSVISKHTF